MQHIFLSRSFGHWIISGNNTEIHLQADRTDEAPCDCLWRAICEEEIRRVKPKTLEDLMEVVTKLSSGEPRGT